MTTFPTPPEEPLVHPGDPRRWIIVGTLWGVAFLGLMALIVRALGLE